MTFVGSDTDQLRTFATTIDQATEHIDSLISTLHGTANNVVWVGNDATQFRGIVERLATTNVAQLVQRLHVEAAALRANADAQDSVSASLEASAGAGGATGAAAGGSSKGHVGPDGPHSTRLDSPEARKAALDSLARFLKSSGGRQYLPGAFAKGDAWLKELQSGNPTPEQVQAFQSYMAMVKLANLQRGVVADAANTAFSEYTNGVKAGVDAAAGAATLELKGGTAFDAKDVAGAVIGGGLDLAKGSAIDAGTHGQIAQGAQGLIDHYNQRADAYLQGLIDHAKQGTTVGFAEPSKLAFANWDVYKSRYDQVLTTIDKADAFTPLTGDGSVLETGLRSAMKVVPVAGTTLDVAAIVGNSAQAGYHFQAGAQALDLVLNGSMQNLTGFAQALKI